MSDTGSQERPPESDRTVVAQTSRPDRTVFTEEGNTDGWIASDLVIPVER